MRVVCAWCQRDMHGDPTDPCAAVSHSVCPSCTAQLAYDRTPPADPIPATAGSAGAGRVAPPVAATGRITVIRPGVTGAARIRRMRGES